MTVVEIFENIVLNLEPWALILRLILGPYQLRKIREFFQLRGECFVREWIQLLDSNNCRISLSSLLACIDQIVIDLAGASNHALDHLGIDFLIDLANHGLK